MRPDLVCVGEVLLDVTMPQLAQGAVIHARSRFGRAAWR
jgi:hypothetical protein